MARCPMGKLNSSVGTVENRATMAIAQRFYAGDLGSWAAGLSLAELDDAVIRAAKAAVLDTWGVSLAGSRFNRVLQSASLASAGTSSGAVVLGAGLAGRPQEAAFLNGISAHVLDFDDTCFAGILHGSAVILPAVLAAAELAGADGRKLLEGFVAGSEVAYALGAGYGDSLYEAGCFPTALIGQIGAAAGAAKILGGDAVAIARAIALAAASSAGMRVVLGSDLKPLLVGMAARQALESAQLAQADLSFPADVFEGKNGFFQLIRGAATPEPQPPGDPFRLLDPGLTVKLYPLCSATQPALAALKEILAEKDIDVQEIEEITCRATPMVLVSLPYAEPENPTQAQFSLPFAFAAALLSGGPGPGDLAEAAWCKQDMRDLMSKISLVVDDSGELAKLGHEAAEVCLRLADGLIFRACRGVAVGDLRDPLTPEALAAKFLGNSEDLLGAAGSRRLLDLIHRLEELPDLAEISFLSMASGAMIEAAFPKNPGEGALS